MTPQLKSALAFNATSATAAGTVTALNVDTLGYDWCTIDVWGTTQVGTSQTHSPSVLRLTECDTTNGTFVDVVGARGGSATATNVDFLVGSVTAASNVPAYKFNVDCRARKRYLSVLLNPATSQTFYGVANLGRGEQSPSTASKANVLSLIEV